MSSEMGHHHSQPVFYPDSRIVSTNCGQIIGRRLIHEGEKQVDGFQGIPYAKPPVGPLRFKKAEPHEPWTDIRKCQAFGNRSIQKDHMGSEKVKNKMPPVSEDCLTLNVFTPVWEPAEEEGFAVLVFIHGGAFLSDSAVKYGDLSLCEHICKKNIVMVTLQYRLGYLGLWSTGDSHCPGNLMFWDQTFALQWIKDNIKNFNGNPNNITLMGQSAGGCSVDLLSLSPHSRDLFHKVIPMAGNASCNWSTEFNVTEACRQAAESFGVTCCDDSDKYLDELRKISAETFALSIMDRPVDGTELKLGPRLDGHFLTKHPDELRKEAPAKPRIYGLTRSEGLFMVAGAKSKQKETHIYKIAAYLFPEKDYPNDFARLRQEYAAKVRELIKEGEKDSLIRAITQAAGDEFLGIGTQKAVVDSLENGDAPVYLYRMDYFNPKMYNGLGNIFPFKDASHCSDISYIVAEAIGVPFEFEEDDYKVVEVMTTLWTNFAKYGNPNGTGESLAIPRTEQWLPATKEDPQRHLQIDMESKMSSNFYEGRPLWYVKTEKELRKKNTHF